MTQLADRPDPPITPVIIKTRPEAVVWPEGERMFYVLGSNGLHICRNHGFFKSCAPARDWPSELAEQESFLLPDYPKIPRESFERIVGFFDRIGELHGSEASVILAWDPARRCVEIVVPRQTGTVYTSSTTGKPHPIGLHYYPPTDLPPEWIVFGDVHSHVNLSAYASATDKSDEEHSPGLHIVVGRIHTEPPEIHIDAVVDGTRFSIEREDVIEGYHERSRDVPQSWIDMVQVEVEEYSSWSSYPSYGGAGGSHDAS